MTEPSNAEVARRIEEVARTMSTLAAQMQAQSEANERTFVRKDVYVAEQATMHHRMSEVETDVDDRAKADVAREKSANDFRKQVMIMLMGIAIPMVIGFILQVQTYLAKGTP